MLDTAQLHVVGLRGRHAEPKLLLYLVDLPRLRTDFEIFLRGLGLADVDEMQPEHGHHHQLVLGEHPPQVIHGIVPEPLQARVYLVVAVVKPVTESRLPTCRFRVRNRLANDVLCGRRHAKSAELHDVLDHASVYVIPALHPEVVELVVP